MKNYGFVRVGAAVPELKVSDCGFNTEKILELMAEAAEKGVYVTVFPELCITGFTCGDLFRQSCLLKSALESLNDILNESRKWNNIYITGLPLLIDQGLYDCAAVIRKGRIIGIIPKCNVINAMPEQRLFKSGSELTVDSLRIFNYDVPVGTDLIFQDGDNPELQFAIEICEDMLMPVPASSIHALNGAVIICNLSAASEEAGKLESRITHIKSHAERCIAGYLYASAGVGESTTDMVFGGHALISELGAVLAQNERFCAKSQLIISEIDIQKLVHDRAVNSSFSKPQRHDGCRRIPIEPVNTEMKELNRGIKKHPFIPSDEQERKERCREIFTIQASGLAKRYSHTGLKKAVIGISGGLDSTLALLVTVHTFDILGISRENILAVTMPGFGTTNQTYKNAMDLMKSLGVHIREINIKEACLLHFRDIGHEPEIHDVTYENVQARERTQILMDIANKEGGLVIGTGDLSELALGWCTYNGDHMSMYSVNCGVPKTLIRHIVKWAALNIAEKETSRILECIVDTPITPELLPPSATGEILQKTEDIVGPYELHDFFLYHTVRYGADPEKVLFLAGRAFRDQYDEATILKWLKFFYKRFFTQQFKRSCVPDGPKVGTVCLSPRTSWYMPSDASSSAWLGKC